MQAAAADKENEPAGQVAQALDPDEAEKYPASQFEQEGALPIENLPITQFEQPTLLFELASNWPAGHAVQTLAPVALA